MQLLKLMVVAELVRLFQLPLNKALIFFYLMLVGSRRLSWRQKNTLAPHAIVLTVLPYSGEVPL